YDVTGKIVKAIKLDNLEAGNHSSKISLSDLNAGVYMYSVKSDNAKMYSKFTITK
ncbi:T9SS type A sorting domain-containing protein, partial [Lactococcus cremoris]|uniref:T9SS type A sorting domain-containing protein n=1 Tax=Lactococcus lactis subsp. cremoris TaxID=1359 RepID=UPI00385534AC